MRIRGFTLLELVLVLGILAALTAVAVRSMDAIQEQARYDDARRGMDGIDAAIVGVPNEREADGSAMATGFVADVGRLPRATGADPATQLQELWANPANLLPFAMRPAPSDAEVIVGTGWRGTYLRLGIGRTTLTDGWGRPYDLLKADAATPVAAGDEIVAIRSRGADGLVDAGPAAGYDPDILLSFAGTGTGGVPRYAAAVSGRVFQWDAAGGQLKDPDPAGGSIVVRCFGPDPDTGGVRETVVSIDPPFTSVTYSFPALTIGPRVLRAYQGSPTVVKSVSVRIVLQAGGLAKDLVLR